MPLERPPEDKFSHNDLSYLRDVFLQYAQIDTESCVASFSPGDVENYRRAAKERRPFPYETVRNWHKISEMSSHKVSNRGDQNRKMLIFGT